jgi:hypothetical protein
LSRLAVDNKQKTLYQIPCHSKGAGMTCNCHVIDVKLM